MSRKSLARRVRLKRGDPGPLPVGNLQGDMEDENMKLWEFMTVDGKEYEFWYDELSKTAKAIGPVTGLGSAPTVAEVDAESEAEAVEKLKEALGIEGNPKEKEVKPTEPDKLKEEED